MNLREPLHGKERGWERSCWIWTCLQLVIKRTERNGTLEKVRSDDPGATKEATLQINSPLKATTSVAATPPKTDIYESLEH